MDQRAHATADPVNRKRLPIKNVAGGCSELAGFLDKWVDHGFLTLIPR